MKSLILFSSVLLILSISQLLSDRSQPSSVYVCRSGSAYAYHNQLCRGLRSCTHKIDTVTLKKAIADGYKKACGYCYK